MPTVSRIPEKSTLWPEVVLLQRSVSHGLDSRPDRAGMAAVSRRWTTATSKSNDPLVQLGLNGSMVQAVSTFPW